MTLDELKQHQPILFYDGVCNLCNSWVKLVIRNEKKPVLTFAALQSEAGDAVKSTFGNKPIPDSLMVYVNGKVYVKSDAALQLVKYLRGGWPLLAGLYIFPAFLRNLGYDFIARNRYRWFGQKDECMIPSPRGEEEIPYVVMILSPSWREYREAGREVFISYHATLFLIISKPA